MFVRTISTATGKAREIGAMVANVHPPWCENNTRRSGKRQQQSEATMQQRDKLVNKNTNEQQV